ncbi:hypothetical protein SAMN05421644_12542 [Allochromatium warmingii]|uniref:Uncharacterized protein n=1 Tax=Allochromatium warmingii TaxID=61595 RepID=A0A1H3GL49_ALLWA|nr:hypothetical protein [Allochromatium warmingii]SDY03790.1 hypothetical protein SAMN05421644_12542 [Allochromatium warmingii]
MFSMLQMMQRMQTRILQYVVGHAQPQLSWRAFLGLLLLLPTLTAADETASPSSQDATSASAIVAPIADNTDAVNPEHQVRVLLAPA